MSKKRMRDIPVEKPEKPSKVQYAVAKYLRNNVPTKKTKFLNHQVNYFYANKAVDCLLDSPWATGKDVVFTTRESVVEFLDQLLSFKFFHRAKKIQVTDKDYKPKELKKKKEKELEEKKKKEKELAKKKKETKKEKEKSENEEEEKDKEKEKEKEKEEEEKEKSQDEGEKKEEKEKKKKKAKIKLDMHLEQVFVDGTDAYVWMYDPVPFWYWIVGALCLFGAIAICLFPLWPPTVRKGVYYLSVAAAMFLGFILGLAVIRAIVFFIIWAISFGKHHFWILPNLTEDVGFFASFWPLYKYEYRGDGKSKKKSKKKKKEEEEDEDEDEEEEEKDNERETKSEGEETAEAPDTDVATSKLEGDSDRPVIEEQTAQSESESDNSNSQAFEMVHREELDHSDEHQEETEENEDVKKERKKEEGSKDEQSEEEGKESEE
ncbi:translocation protein 1 isoform X2 [Oratosquilla oratoria]|uniref:translocation protein 1 isoform X2 n=1 Tax=Oratosquilla oratoria TaxID=337810 RepID=UPI003F767888